METATHLKDPVCGMDVNPMTTRSQSEYEGQPYYFCSNACQLAFEDAPQQYLGLTDSAAGCACCGTHAAAST